MFFRSSRIRTLVAIVNNSSCRLIMGKEEIVFFSVSFGIIFGIFSYRNVKSSFLRFIRLFCQISEFDWLSVLQKGSIFVKMFKNLFINQKGYEAATCHTCL